MNGAAPSCVLITTSKLHDMQAAAEVPADPDAADDADAPADDRLAETYDDAEFYQQLLKEFLEGSAAAGARVQTLSQAST